MVELEVLKASRAQEVALRNMMQLYVHDFSEHWAGRSAAEQGGDARFGQLGEDGRFLDYPLDDYWTKDDHAPLLIRADGFLAGFALLNAQAHSGRPVDHNMAEFFIVRRHRRGGVGTRAAHEIFSRYPGQWEAAIARRNVGALGFWRHAAASHPRASGIEETDHASADWNGPILRFAIGG